MSDKLKSEFDISPEDYEKYSKILNEHFENFLFIGRIKGTKSRLAALDSNKMDMMKQIGNIMISSETFSAMILTTVEIYNGFLKSEAKKNKK